MQLADGEGALVGSALKISFDCTMLNRIHVMACRSQNGRHRRSW